MFQTSPAEEGGDGWHVAERGRANGFEVGQASHDPAADALLNSSMPQGLHPLLPGENWPAEHSPHAPPALPPPVLLLAPYPAGQPTHARGRAPSAGLGGKKVPGGQPEHAAVPGVLVKVPVAQATHAAAALSSEAYPTGHAVQPAADGSPWALGE